MELTSDIVDRYKGGQLESQNQSERYLYRGEIEDIFVSGDHLTVRLAWCAKAKGFPGILEGWLNADENLDYSVRLAVCSVSDGGQGRLILNAPIVGETTVLFPPGGSRLDPSKVEGLELAAS